MWNLCSKKYEDGFPYLVPPPRLSEADRLAILARMIEGIVALEKLGIGHEDIHPTIIMVVDVLDNAQKALPAGLPTLSPTSPEPTATSVIAAMQKRTTLTTPPRTRVVLLDLGRSEIDRYLKAGPDFVQFLPRPLHPTSRFSADSLDEFAGWFPRSWLENEDLFEDWLMRTFKMEDYTWHKEAEEIARNTGFRRRARNTGEFVDMGFVKGVVDSQTELLPGSEASAPATESSLVSPSPASVQEQEKDDRELVLKTSALDLRER